MIEKSLSGIVLTANVFNPSIFTETWLVKNNLVPDDALTGPRIFTQEFAQFQTSEMQVLVIPPKMQIVFTIGDNGKSDSIIEFAARVVDLLPQTPYQALGLNFDYFVAPPEGHDFQKYNRALLAGDADGLLKEFSSPDARFGRYFSKNYEEARLRLSILPIKDGLEPSKQEERMKFSFNFSYDVEAVESAERPKRLVARINEWSDLHDYSERLTKEGSKLTEGT